MQVSTRLKNQHLLWRAGFGPSIASLLELNDIKTADLFEALIKKSADKPSYLDVADNELQGLLMGLQAVIEADEEKQMIDKRRQTFRKKSVESIHTLNQQWMDLMVRSEAQLREKAALFWHGHFACRNLNLFYQQLLLNEIRTHALGNYRTMLKAVSKTAAMLFFLNNQQNKKDEPNENFAREVMELFTLGRGNYTEQDIKESARAFTGWTAKLDGSFVFRSFFHDDGQKTILKKTGKFSGEDVLEILLDQPQTALFICKKIYRFYVNENINIEHLGWLTKRFYESDYNISQLLSDILTSDWFYDETNIGSMIKSPVALLCGMRRQLSMQFNTPAVELKIQQLLGQILFYPPNVAGWPGDKNWIDSSSLLFRMQLPQVIINNEAVQLKMKRDDDVQMGESEKQPVNGKKDAGVMFSASIHWDTLMKNSSINTKGDTTENLSAFLLQKPLSESKKNVIQLAAQNAGADAHKKITAAIMSTPEYQLC